MNLLALTHTHTNGNSRHVLDVLLQKYTVLNIQSYMKRKDLTSITETASWCFGVLLAL